MLAFRLPSSRPTTRRGLLSLDWFREVILLTIPTLLLGGVLVQAWVPTPSEFAAQDTSGHPIHFMRPVDNGRQIWVGRWGQDCRAIDAEQLTEVSGYLARSYELSLCSRSPSAINLSLMIRFDERLEIYRDDQLIHQEMLTTGTGWATDTDISADGRFAFMSRTDGTGRLWTFHPDQKITCRDVNMQDHVNGICFSPCSRRFVAYSNTRFTLWDAEQLVLLKAWPVPEDLRRPRPTSFAWAPDGKSVYASFEDGKVMGWNPESADELHRWNASHLSVATIAISPDGQTLATGGFDKTVRVWSLDDLQVKWTGQAHVASVRSLAFDGSGRRLFSGGLDGKMFVWEDGLSREIH